MLETKAAPKAELAPKAEPDAEPPSWELGKNRIEALSDGIFAIAMTLLVLNFHIPNLPHEASNVRVLPALLRMWPSFVTYVVSFLSLGVFWIGHHNMYHAVRRSDRTLLWLSILFFMFVSSLPFATSVLNAFPNTQVAPLFFGANLTLIGWLLYIQWAYAGRQADMLAAFVTEHHRRVVGRRFLLYPVVATFTMAICFWSIPISLGLYLILLPLYVIPGKVERPAPGRLAFMHGGTPQMRRGRTAAAMGLALILLVGGWAAFRPELLFLHRTAHDSLLPAASTVLAQGTFHGVAHPTHGTATVYQLPGSSTPGSSTPGAGRELRLTDFQTSNGPDVRVFLIKASDAMDEAAVTGPGYVELGRLRGSRGDQNYPLPADLNLSQFHAVTIWCRRFKVNFATASLKSPVPVKSPVRTPAPAKAGTASR